MYGNDTRDILALEFAVTYYLMQDDGVGSRGLQLLTEFAYRTIGQTAFQAALEVCQKKS